MIRNISLLVGLTLITLLFVTLISPSVYAVDVISPVCDNPNAVETPEVCKGTARGEQDSPEDNPLFGPYGILTRVINILSFIGGVAAVITIMVAGFRYVTSNGDTNTTASAQKAIIYGVVGLIVIALAQTIVIFVLNNLT